MNNNNTSNTTSDPYIVSPVESVQLARPWAIDQPSTSENFWRLIDIMLRRRKWIIGSIIAFAALALLVDFVMTPVYDATATVELKKSENDSIGLDFGLGDVGGQSMGLGGGDLTTDLTTESEVLKSDSVALSVIQNLDLASRKPFIKWRHAPFKADSSGQFSPEARSWLLKRFDSNLKVSPDAGTRLIKVTYYDRDPKLAADIANGIIDSYKDQYLRSHYEAVSEASDWMTKQLSALKANVETSEKRLTDFEKSSGILTFPSVSDATNDEQSGGGGGAQVYSPVIQKLQNVTTELTSAEADRLGKEAIYRIAQTGNADVITGLMSSPLGQYSSPAVGGDISNLQQLEMKLSDFKVGLSQALAVYGPNNRHLKDLQGQEAVLNEQIADATKEVVETAGADLQVARQTEDSLRTRFNQQQEEASQLNEKNVELTVLSQDAFSQKKLYEDLYTKLQEADVSAGIKATNVTLVDPARPAWLPNRPRKSLYLVLGILIGTFLGVGIAYFVESIDKSIVRTAEIEEITGSPVIGVIPTFRETIRGRLSRSQKKSGRALAKARDAEMSSSDAVAWVLRHPTSPGSEAFRSLRSSIYLSRPGGAPKAILVTSSVPAEGKTTVTSNLAISIAQQGKKVIIVDADLRRPRIMDVFKIPNDVGLSTVLAGAVTLQQAILQGVNAENLDVLPAGPPPPMPSELLGSPSFHAILDELRSRYDMVLIDSPPALILSDAVSIAATADSVVWVVRAGSASRPYLKRAAQLIRRGRLAFIGFVLNGVDSKADPYGYGYGYGYTQYDEYYGANNASDS